MTINRGALRMTTKLKNSKKRKMYKDSKLVGGQVKLDKNKDGKISGEDFKKLKKGSKVKK